MIGKNQLELCHAEMMAAVQWYLNTKVFSPDHQVVVASVSQRGHGDDDFIIVIEQPKLTTKCTP